MRLPDPALLRHARCLLLAAGALAVVHTGCVAPTAARDASVAEGTRDDATEGAMDDDAAPAGATTAAAETFAPPASPEAAQLMLARAMVALQRGEHARAGRMLRAIVRSDHPSESGRARLYWLAAEAFGAAGDDDARNDALGGFLVASQLVPDDHELRERAAWARATLLAGKMRAHPAMGSSPHTAIRVLSARDADALVARLPCGRAGTAHYVERTREGREDDEGRLEARKLLCTETGQGRVLWFALEP